MEERDVKAKYANSNANSPTMSSGLFIHGKLSLKHLAGQSVVQGNESCGLDAGLLPMDVLALSSEGSDWMETLHRDGRAYL